MGVLSKRQDDVFTALEFIRGRLPFVLLGLDSDNGGEFFEQPSRSVLLTTPPDLHWITSLLEERSGPHRAEELVHGAQSDGVRPLRELRGAGSAQSRV
jgi:hypothetical protein